MAPPPEIKGKDKIKLFIVASMINASGHKKLALVLYLYILQIPRRSLMNRKMHKLYSHGTNMFNAD